MVRSGVKITLELIRRTGGMNKRLAARLRIVASSDRLLNALDESAIGKAESLMLRHISMGSVDGEF